MKISTLAEQIKLGKRRALAKGITLIESEQEKHQESAQQLIAELQDERDTMRIGVSGVPGVGKSTFIEAFGNVLIDAGLRVAVLAVDPSSPTTGGSILGDKTRMETLANREEAFVRPSPTSGTLGGVTKRTRETIVLCEAAGYDIVLIETVGVGQSEYEVASMVDCFMVLMLPGGGDSLQGIKRGILEITDVLVINKADGKQESMAQRAGAEYKKAFHLLKPKYEGIEVPVQLTSSLTGKGIEKTWKTIQDFIDTLKERGLFLKNRKGQRQQWFKRIAEERWLNLLWKNPGVEKELPSLAKRISNQEITPDQAANELLKHVKRED
jgi:LAO/AO transport system kinase